MKREFDEEVEKYGNDYTTRMGDSIVTKNLPRREDVDGEHDPETETIVIPNAYNDTRQIVRKRPVILPSKQFKDQRAMVRMERILKERDPGGWAAEWGREKGDFQYWSSLTADKWFENRKNENIMRASQSQGVFSNQRPQTVNPSPRVDEMIYTIAAQAR